MFCVLMAINSFYRVFLIKIWLSWESTSLLGWSTGPMTKIRMAKNIYKISETIIGTAIYFTASKVEISTMIEAKKQEK